MEEELLHFLRNELHSRDRAIALLHDAKAEAGITNIETATQEQRRNLAAIIKAELPYHSIAKTNIIFSKLLKILKVNVEENSFGKFTLSKEYQEVLSQKQMLEEFWQNVDKSMIKFEIIFNMFWLRAGEAEARGIPHKEIMRLTKKALQGVKEDLEKAYNQLKHEFEIEDDTLKVTKKMELIGIHADLNVKHKYQEMDQERQELKQYIEEFWHIVEKNYRAFEKIFLTSLEQEIKLKKEKKDDKAYIDQVRKELSKIWGNIEVGYQQLQKKIQAFHQKLLDVQKEA